jgi:hypothetical protein
MKTRLVPRTDLTASVLCLGAAEFGSAVDDFDRRAHCRSGGIPQGSWSAAHSGADPIPDKLTWKSHGPKRSRDFQAIEPLRNR